jgi:hypothetical protein
MNKKQPKQAGCGSLIVIVLFLAGIFSIMPKKNKNDNNSDSTTAFNQTTTETETSTTEEKLQNGNFVDDLSQYVDKNLSEKVYNILINDIGFEKVQFEKQLGDSGNYEIFAESTAIVITVMPATNEDEEYIRIFKPETDIVFYEDGKVLMTGADYRDTIIDSDLANKYYVIAQMIIEDNLKNPGSANFPSQREIMYQKKGNLVAVKGYVEAKNDFNAKIQSNFVVEFTVINLDEWEYEINYIKIDNQESGNFIPF